MFKRNNKFVYGSSQTIDSDSITLYSPHPFTNWSLNPHYKIEKEFQHTCEGFRRVDDSLSIRTNWNHNDFSVYAMGGSTTYCTELESYKYTWPSILNKKLGLTVCNAGVGGWGSLQSFIRFSVWGPILKPKLTLVYLSKNDLTPFHNGRKEEEIVHPLYENIMLQMSSKIKSITKYTDLSSLYTTKSNRLFSLYEIQGHRSSDGLSRFTEEHLLTTKARFQIISDLAKQWNGRILFIPEIIKKDSIYYTKMQQIHKIMEEVDSNNSNTDFYDIKKIFDYRKEYFLDKMHFNEKGCQIFAELLGNYINKEYVKNK